MRRDAEEEEYDPVNPAVGSVASVVRVKPRPKVPAALQANKNLILKAMAEAQKSVASAPKRVEPHEVSYIAQVKPVITLDVTCLCDLMFSQW
jgi:hypothetical protein